MLLESFCMRFKLLVKYEFFMSIKTISWVKNTLRVAKLRNTLTSVVLILHMLLFVHHFK